MSNLARVRVELKNYNPHASYDERYREFNHLLRRFWKHCTEAGVMHDYKQHECYESKSRKRRRKERQFELQQLKAKLKENFGQRGGRG